MNLTAKNLLAVCKFIVIHASPCGLVVSRACPDDSMSLTELTGPGDWRGRACKVRRRETRRDAVGASPYVAA